MDNYYPPLMPPGFKYCEEMKYLKERELCAWTAQREAWRRFNQSKEDKINGR